MKTSKIVYVLIMALIISSANIYGSTDWRYIYQDYIAEDNYMSEINLPLNEVVLIDLDLNGIPEMLSGSISDTYCPVEIAWSIKDGKVVELVDTTNGISGNVEYSEGYEHRSGVGLSAFLDAELYLDKTTNTYKWIGYDYSKPMEGYYYHGMYELTLKNNNIISDMIFYNSFTPHNADTFDAAQEHYEFRGKEVSKSTFYKERENYFKNLEKIEIGAKLSKELSNDSLQSLTNLFFEYRQKSFPKKAIPSVQQLIVNDKAFKLQSYQIDGSNYFKLRDLAMVFSHTNADFVFETSPETGDMAIMGGEYIPVGGELKLDTNKGTIVARASLQTISVQNNIVDTDIFLINNNNYVNLRDFNEVWCHGQITPISKNTIKITVE